MSLLAARGRNYWPSRDSHTATAHDSSTAVGHFPPPPSVSADGLGTIIASYSMPSSPGRRRPPGWLARGGQSGGPPSRSGRASPTGSPPLAGEQPADLREAGPWRGRSAMKSRCATHCYQLAPYGRSLPLRSAMRIAVTCSSLSATASMLGASPHRRPSAGSAARFSGRARAGARPACAAPRHYRSTSVISIIVTSRYATAPPS